MSLRERSRHEASTLNPELLLGVRRKFDPWAMLHVLHAEEPRHVGGHRSDQRPQRQELSAS